MPGVDISIDQPAAVKRSAIVAGFFSLVSPGLGQIYNGQARKALILLGVFTAVMFLSRSYLSTWLGVPFLLFIYSAFAATWVLAILDALLFARKPRPKAAYERWYIFVGYFLLLPIVLVLIAQVAKFTAMAEPYLVPANSMAPAIAGGDYVMVDLVAFRSGKPKAGDVLVFRYPKEEGVNYMKRVIGVAGDKIEIRNKILFVNGKKISAKKISDPEMENTLLAEDKESLSLFEEEIAGRVYSVFYNMNSLVNSNYGPVEVPAGEYFVLGDSRDRSSDSRIWGFVPEKNVIGQPKYIYLSKDTENGKVRWNRIGKRIN